jgi:chaperonin GroEL (HSP60 family)
MLNQMSVMHPSAKMLVDLAHAQDIEAGDGTTSVVVIAGSLLGAAERLLGKGIHPTVISEAFQRAAQEAISILTEMAIPISLTDRQTLLKTATTALSSKIVAQEPKLPIMAVDSVLKVIDPKTADNVDLKNIRMIKKSGGTIEDSEMIDGLVLNQPVVKSAGGPTLKEKARIGLIQFQLSPPKPDMENQIVVNDYRQMDKILKEERTYLLNMVKKIQKAKCNVLFIQKSILRDAVNDLSLHFLSKLKILVIKDIERDEIEFICKVRIENISHVTKLMQSRALAASQLPISTHSQKTSSVRQTLSRRYRHRAHDTSRFRASSQRPPLSLSSAEVPTTSFWTRLSDLCTTLTAPFARWSRRRRYLPVAVRQRLRLRISCRSRLVSSPVLSLSAGKLSPTPWKSFRQHWRKTPA